MKNKINIRYSQEHKPFKMRDHNILEETKKILRENDVRLKKKRGQSFIVNQEYISKQLQAGKLDKNDIVLEIGAGIGNLTVQISPLVKKIYAIELDHTLADILRRRINSYNNIEVVECDALKCDFPNFNKIIANIPYNIASPLTFKILSYKFEVGILMYQLEFAKRLIAKPGEKEYSRLSVNAALKADIEIIELVPRIAFYPQPKVDSAIVKILPKEINLKSGVEQIAQIVNRLFPYRNKKVYSAIKHYMSELNVNKEFLKQILATIPYSEVRVRDMNINMLDDLTVYILDKMRCLR
ncbi:MAG: 16S rRNA (adenine(1518)-N(6)/adenine(1519)-N(6))-dimethyltransferase RsmA [Candidatus Odinarchaeum yellowstonii]|uniref:16S rRNA (Adenine(1518)-N(6)/adenine(1519)-N(6))-dimethyltransferase RsmA n=1 Tax=Odinarchaeota yellowstonii (strain LCB_4) TaxID=1841599 RepID=A0AAF0IAL2_ODILC|nr:MAG: 16S rRNA (adenine(1518)-N(6)/adenine(1519)-N(6))-dimethyltransferase RsmA [Candidatus Odinarchaeum yellowstonii]